MIWNIREVPQEAVWKDCERHAQCELLSSHPSSSLFWQRKGHPKYLLMGGKHVASTITPRIGIVRVCLNARLLVRYVVCDWYPCFLVVPSNFQTCPSKDPKANLCLITLWANRLNQRPVNDHVVHIHPFIIDLDYRLCPYIYYGERMPNS